MNPAAEQMGEPSALDLVAALLARSLAGADGTSLARSATPPLRALTNADSCEVFALGNGRAERLAGTGPANASLSHHVGHIGDDTLVSTMCQLGTTVAVWAETGVPESFVADATDPNRAGPLTMAVPIGAEGSVDGALVARCIGTRGLAEGSGTLLEAVAAVLALSSRRRGAEQEAARLARHDDLTGLVNREVFLERLAAALEIGAGEHATGVAIVDLDYFQLINDGLGHQTGDNLLQAVAHRLRDALRPGDVLASFGGDEFAVLSRRLNRADDARLAGERVRAALNRPFSIADHELTVRASVGVAVRASDEPLGSDTALDAEELVRDADAALSVAKDRGRERVEVFVPSMTLRVAARLRTEGELRSALAEDQLRIFYQPIIDFGTGRTAGVEALARWAHPTRGLIAPTEFIPISETTGLIEDIGLWVIGTAVAELGRWTAEGNALPVALNVAQRQLVDPRLLPMIDRALIEHNVDATLLSVELSERALVAGDPAILAAVTTNLTLLSERGISITIDDFGAGTAALAQLRHLPVSTVKIDRALVAQVASSGADYAIVAALISVARTLDKVVIAAGIENDQQFELLADLGCDLGQGYLFSAAVHDIGRSDLRDASPTWLTSQDQST